MTDHQPDLTFERILMMGYDRMVAAINDTLIMAANTSPEEAIRHLAEGFSDTAFDAAESEDDELVQAIVTILDGPPTEEQAS